MTTIREKIYRLAPPCYAVLVLLVVWELAVVSGLIPNFLLPTPSQVVQALIADAPLLAEHTATTLVEALSGLALGIAAGFVLALIMDRVAGMRRALEPLLTISQTVPTVAIAPLLVLWLGYGMVPKVVLVALTTFFPVTVSLLAGFASVDADVVDLLRTMRATRWQIFWHAKLPAAMSSLVGGLRIAVTYAVVAAVIAEWLGGSSGLGVYMTRVRKSFAYDRMFASIMVISALSIALIGAVDLLQRVFIPWNSHKKGDN